VKAIPTHWLTMPIFVLVSLIITPYIGRCALNQEDALRFYVVSDKPIGDGRYIDTPDCPKLGYIGRKPDLVITHLQSVSTNTWQITSYANGKSSVETRHAIQIQMLAPDTKRFAELTRQNIGRHILVSFGDRPLTAPAVAAPIESGNVHITFAPGGDFEAIATALRRLVRP
jgi:hypothetical protein